MNSKVKQNPELQAFLIGSNPRFSDFWQDIIRFRELFFFLAWRDIIVRYKQTVIGVLWGIIQPLLTMLILTIVFGKIAKLPSGNVPYPVLVFSAMLPWYFFSASFSAGSASLISNSNLVTKVYFPRIILPASGMIVSFIDFLCSCVVLAAIMIWYQFVPDWKILLLPFFLLSALVASLGAGLWISALNVKYRDFRYIIPFILQFGLYVSPVGFSSTVIPEQWRFWYSLNPMVGVIDGFRWAICGAQIQFYWPGFIISLVLTWVMLCSGLWYFRKMEKEFADVI
jgi:lipopolysaccharide transport system permease protein